ncbi:hypothetical protein B0H13DRAFT_2272893 [Mycena leptocephala]|nr:hypothetical protein B0H13DRAFT_2272893 [Mycena leptocephala]
MPKLRLAVAFLHFSQSAMLFRLLTASDSSSAIIHPRDGSSTSASTNFTFAIPTTGDQRDPDVTDWISVVCFRIREFLGEVEFVAYILCQPDQITKEQCDIEGVGMPKFRCIWDSRPILRIPCKSPPWDYCDV